MIVISGGGMIKGEGLGGSCMRKLRRTEADLRAYLPANYLINYVSI
jgi:hypothetical protein